MIVDLKFTGKELVIIKDDGIDLKKPIEPYFYIIHKKDFQLAKFLGKLDVKGVKRIEETNYKAVINIKGSRYEIDDNYVVKKVVCTSPNVVPSVANAYMLSGFKASAFNIRYLARCSFDLDLHYFNSYPLYYGLDPKIMENISKLKILVIDVEAIENKPVLASCLYWSPLSEVNKDDVMHFKLPEQSDELQKILNKSYIILGHNVLGFDIPILRKNNFNINIMAKSVIDTSATLSSWGSSFWIGSARSLLDVAKAMAKNVGITREEIEIKERSRGKISKMSWEDLVKYNVNDVVITCKIANVVSSFLAVVSALTQIPISILQNLTAGLVAEYYLFHELEMKNIIPEYKKVIWKASHEKVYIERENLLVTNVGKYDIKMMYPTFVINYFVDPTLLKREGKKVDEIEFDRKSGFGLIWSITKKMYEVRKMTKKLKKQNPAFESVDMGVKALINALAYGVQGKKSGYSIMGNEAVPEYIFLKTSEITFNVIKNLRKKGFRVVYGDTDSFFVYLEDRDPNEVLKALNEELAKYGLEADFEGTYQNAYFLKKKNYILVGDDVIVKGGKIRIAMKFYLPRIISSNIIEIIKANYYERKKVINELIDSANIEELFPLIAQQLWRLVGKDPQSVKKIETEKGKKYVRVLTEWEDKPQILLKKCGISHWLMPSHSPLFNFMISLSTDRLMLHEYDAYFVLDALYLYIKHSLFRIFSEFLSYKENERGIFYINDNLYLFRLKSVNYILRDKAGSTMLVNSNNVDSIEAVSYTHLTLPTKA